MGKKKGILLVNLGTPDNPERKAVYRYLKEFLLDKRVIDIPWLQRNLLVRLIIAPFRSAATSRLYKKLWTPEGSPLKINGYKLLEGLKQRLGPDYVVELAMRYQSPSIESGLMSLRKAAVDEIIVLPLFPHYASASTGSVHEEVMRIVSEWQVVPEMKLINSFYDLEGMIDVFISNANKYDVKSYDHILFSYHGLPQRQMIKANDFNHCLQSPDCCQAISEQNKFCYSAQCYATTRALVAKMGLTKDQYTTCFQSRLGKDPWIQPYTSKILEERRIKGDKSLLVFCPAFVSDCLETTIEVEEEYRDEFIKQGGEKLDLVESLNDNPQWIDVLANYIREQ